MVKGETISRNTGSFLGGGLGGFLSSPFGLGALGVAALGITLFLFRDKISDFFSKSLKGAIQTDVNILPSIELPSFEGFTLPTLEIPSFPSLAQLFPATQGPVQQQEIDVIPDTTGGLAERRGGLTDIITTILPTNTIPLDPNRPLSLAQIQPMQELIEPIRTVLGGGDALIVPQGDELALGGGPSFIGGTTTFGDNIIDTFGEVLNIFPDLRASEISNLLAENVGLTGSEFALIDPAGEINLSSAGGDPEQTLLNASGGFTGLTAEQISLLLTGGNISNF